MKKFELDGNAVSQWTDSHLAVRSGRPDGAAAVVRIVIRIQRCTD